MLDAHRPRHPPRVEREVQEGKSKASFPTTPTALSSATLHEKLAAVPASAWEDELPVLDACIWESQRIAIMAVTLRRNVQKEMKIGEQVVKRGDFLVYSLADVHLNLEYYPEPHKYDPGRWLQPDPVPNTIYPSLGWGAGRHPCPGIKVAKLEMKLILALFLTRYEFNLVDKDGKFPDPLPVPKRNDIYQVRVEPRVRHPIRCSRRLPFPHLSRLVPLELRATSISRGLWSRLLKSRVDAVDATSISLILTSLLFSFV